MFLINMNNVYNILEKRYVLNIADVNKKDVFHPKLSEINGIEIFKALENALTPKEKSDFNRFIKSKMYKQSQSTEYEYKNLEHCKDNYEFQLMIIIIMQYYFCI